jgi:hypothetical protein
LKGLIALATVIVAASFKAINKPKPKCNLYVFRVNITTGKQGFTTTGLGIMIPTVVGLFAKTR